MYRDRPAREAVAYVREEMTSEDWACVDEDNRDGYFAAEGLPTAPEAYRTVRDAAVADLEPIVTELDGVNEGDEADEADEADELPGELDLDSVEALGLDGTGRDGNERFPYTIFNLTDDERRRLWTLAERGEAYWPHPSDG